MKLYYSPGACSFASNIALREAGMNFDLVKVDIRAKQCAEGDYKKINPKGYVPALRMDNGEVLTENIAILSWIADQKPEKNLLPKWGTMERTRSLEWLAFISTEIHKGFSGFFNPALTEDGRKALTDRLYTRLEILDQHFKNNQYVLGSNFSVADAYAFTVIGWSGFLKVDISQFKNILGFMERVQGRPTVQAARASEA